MRRYLIPLILITIITMTALPTTPGIAQNADPYANTGRLGRGLVRSLAWSPDGELLAVGGALGIWLYTPEFGDVGRLTGHTKAIYGMAFSPDGARLASVSHDMTVRIWDIDTQSELHTLTGHTDLVVAVDWSPDGQTVISGAYDGTVRAWNPDTGESLGIVGTHDGWVDEVAFSHAGGQWATVGHDGMLYIWDAATNALVWETFAHSGGVQALAWRADGSQIVTVGRDGRARLWDASNRGPVWDIQAHDDVIYDVDWSGDVLLTASWDGTIGAWSANDAAPLATLTNHTGRVQRVGFAPNDSDRAASLGWDDTVRLWDLATYSEVSAQHEHMDFITALAWSDDGAHLIDVTLDGRAHIWEAATGALIDVATGRDASDGTRATTSDGTRYADIDSGGVVRVIDAVSDDVIMELPGRANAVSWHPDGNTLAVAVRNGTINLWSEQ